MEDKDYNSSEQKLLTRAQVAEKVKKISDGAFVRIDENAVIWVPVTNELTNQLQFIMDFIMNGLSEQEQMDCMLKINLSVSKEEEMLEKVKSGEVEVSPAEASMATLLNIYHTIGMYAHESGLCTVIDNPNDNITDLVTEMVIDKEEGPIDEETTNGKVVIKPKDTNED